MNKQQLESWQSDILPVNMIKFRLDKKQGNVAINGVEVKHIPTAVEIVENSTLEMRNRRFYR